MNIFKSNITFLSKCYPELLVAAKSKLVDEFDYTNELTRNQENNLSIRVNNTTYYLHSRYNARQEAMKWAKSIEDQVANVDNILLLGIGLGHFLEELLAVTKAKNIFIYEPSVLVFKEWLNATLIDGVLLDSRIRLFAVGESNFIPLQLANDISEQLSGSFIEVSPPVYDKLFPGLFKQIKLYLKDTITQQISNMQTRQFNQQTWLANNLYNVPYIINNSSILELKDIYKDKGVEAIIIGSGPSLSHDIHYISQLKDKCLIIAAGSSIQALEHYGVYPHFVVSMDGTISNNKVFENINSSKVPLVFCPSIYYEIVENYKGMQYYARFQSDKITEYLFESDESIPSFISTATVTGTAMQIAEFMGITELILMGQDLSYPNNQFYAPGVEHISDEVQELHLAHSEKWVENVDGGLNRTKGSMEVLLKDLEILVKIMNTRNVNITNTSKGGAVITGTQWMSMDELVPHLLNKPSKDFDISKQIAVKDSTQKMKQTMKIEVKLRSVLKEISKLDSKLKELEIELKKLEGATVKHNANKVASCLVKVNSLWGWITKQEVFTIFYEYSLGHYINIYMRHVPEIVETDNVIKKSKLILDHLALLVKQVQDFTPDLSVTVERSLERLEKGQSVHENKTI